MVVERTRGKQNSAEALLSLFVSPLFLVASTFFFLSASTSPRTARLASSASCRGSGSRTRGSE